MESEEIIEIRAGSEIVFDSPDQCCLVLQGRVLVTSQAGKQALGPGAVIAYGSQACVDKDAQIAFIPLEKLRRIRPEIADQIVCETRLAELQAIPVEGHGGPKYFFEVDAVCPVCGQTFKGIKLFESKLQQISMDRDTRKHFKDIEPAYYRIWVCPKCLYANFSGHRFSEITDNQKAILKEAIADRIKLLAGQNNLKSEAQTAITRYRLAAEVLERGQFSLDMLGRAWLNLAWIYESIEDTETANMARNKSAALYEQFYLESRSMSPAMEIQVMYIIGELSKRLGDLKKAHQYFFKVAHHKENSNSILKDFARDGIQEIRAAAR